MAKQPSLARDLMWILKENVKKRGNNPELVKEIEEHLKKEKKNG